MHQCLGIARKFSIDIWFGFVLFLFFVSSFFFVSFVVYFFFLGCNGEGNSPPEATTSANAQKKTAAGNCNPVNCSNNQINTNNNNCPANNGANNANKITNNSNKKRAKKVKVTDDKWATDYDVYSK